ncbi:hypothetical protein ACM64Y_00440 [Novispirillum sp. DQ9]|uniref:hypothetical protein n=1 Tax=Novispirillum sp. DQ9 TaxID=3398612 RepID=UPI003C7B06F9
MSKSQELTVSVDGDRLVISVGIAELARLAQENPNYQTEDDEPMLRVEDAEAFAGGVAAILAREDEDGDTMVYQMLDGAFGAAIDNGCDGLADD